MSKRGEKERDSPPCHITPKHILFMVIGIVFMNFESSSCVFIQNYSFWSRYEVTKFFVAVFPISIMNSPFIDYPEWTMITTLFSRGVTGKEQKGYVWICFFLVLNKIFVFKQHVFPSCKWSFVDNVHVDTRGKKYMYIRIYSQFFVSIVYYVQNAFLCV